MPTQLPNFATTLQSAEANALPTEGMLNTAANRISSRVAAQQKANNRIAQNHLGSIGRTGGGGFRKALIDNAQNATTGLATGLADLEHGFLDRRQKGAEVLSGLGLGMGRLENEQEALAETERRNRSEEMLDFFRSFIQGGNLTADGHGRGEDFNTDFQRILDSLFGGLA